MDKDQGLLFYVLAVFGIFFLAVLVASYWRKTVNSVITFLYEIILSSRKKEYLPPRIAIEGLGIKRNLNMVEASFLAQKPLPVIYGILMKKAIEDGAIQVVSREPLEIEAEKILPDSLDRIERDFIRICTEGTKKKRQEKLINYSVATIKAVSNKMRGFSLKETVEYYRPALDAASDNTGYENIQQVVGQLVVDMDELTQKVTKATNPFKDAPIFKEEPAYMRSGGGGGSSGGGIIGGRGGGCACAGCACACACAGCACACAGGGR